MSRIGHHVWENNFPKNNSFFLSEKSEPCFSLDRRRVATPVHAENSPFRLRSGSWPDFVRIYWQKRSFASLNGRPFSSLADKSEGRSKGFVIGGRVSLKVCPARVTFRESIGTVGLGAFGTDSIESPFGQERDVAFEALPFDFWLLACEGATAVVFVDGQAYPPPLFPLLFMQKMYHNRFLDCRLG